MDGDREAAQALQWERRDRGVRELWPNRRGPWRRMGVRTVLAYTARQDIGGFRCNIRRYRTFLMTVPGSLISCWLTRVL
jgi:hypothetical protein